MINNPLQNSSNGLGRRTSKAPERVDFSKIATSAQIPNLIEVQRESYNRFLQMDLIPEERRPIGLQSGFKQSFPYPIFARPQPSSLLSIKSETGSANVETWKASSTFGQTVRIVQQRSESIRSVPLRCSAQTAIRLIWSGRISARIAVNPSG